MNTKPTAQPDPQPNVFGYEESFGFSPRFWILVFLTGIGAGLGGAALMGLLRLVEHLAWSYNSGYFLSAVSSSTMRRRLEVLFGAGILVAIFRHVLRRPTGGHGTEVAAAIWFRSGELPFFRTLIGAIASIVIVAFGASLGREGAPKQVGAALAGRLAKYGKLSSSQRRLLVACGAGAGLAAVYNVPLGGALFAVEILLGSLSLSLVFPAMATSLIAVAVSWLFLPNEATYSFPSYPLSPIALAGAVILGVLAGFASAYYVKFIAWADEQKPDGTWRILAPILCFASLGAAAIAYPQLLGNGKDVVQLAFLDRLSMPLLSILVFLRPLATSGCLASGAPGGLFTPTLAFGALLGALFGHVWNHFLPGESAAAYAIFGAGAVLAATMKAPLSAVVLLFELTNHVTTLVVPLILAITLASLVARQLDSRSIYSCRIHFGRSAANRVSSVPTPHVIFDASRVVSAAMPYGELLKRLLSLKARDLPLYVIDETGKLVGEVWTERVTEAEAFAAPLETASAADLAIAARTLDSSLSPAAMNHQLDAEKLTHLPVTDTASKRLLGFYWKTPAS